MRRREFITLFSSAVVAWPLTALAQKPAAKIWRLGILQPGAPPDPLVDTLQERLKELGYSEGHNIAYEYGWAEGKPPRLTELAKELVDLKVDVITAFSTPAAIAAQKATQTIPIVFGGVGDPVGSGVVSSLSRPGGNITGISILATELSAKRLELLEEIVPGASPVAMFWNDSNPGMVLRAHEAQNAAGKLGLNLQSIGVVSMVFKGSNPADLPVELPTKFEMVIGMKAAKALGLTLSQSVVMRADELIE